MAGRACKPDSVPHPNCEAVRARGDHSSSPGIATGIQQPTRGFSIDDGLPSYCRQAPPRKELSLIEPGRLSPPIWPCTTRGFPCPRCYHRSGGLLPHLFTLAKRREHFEDVSQVSLCDATALHSAGGLFSVALSVAPLQRRALARHPQLRPLALPGALPCQEFRSPQNEERASGRCPDFPPAQPSCDDQASDHPARPPFSLYT